MHSHLRHLKPQNSHHRPEQHEASKRNPLSNFHLLHQMPFISDQVYGLVQGKATVTSALAASPTDAVESVAEKLYKHVKRESSKAKVGEPKISSVDLDRAAECGKFTSRPSDLFLQVPRACIFA